jgi:hypothetical protein
MALAGYWSIRLDGAVIDVGVLPACVGHGAKVYVENEEGDKCLTFPPSLIPSLIQALTEAAEQAAVSG